jgi:hypothetical protein
MKDDQQPPTEPEKKRVDSNALLSDKDASTLSMLNAWFCHGDARTEEAIERVFPSSNEYLRRNLLVAKAIGIEAGAKAAIDRLNRTKKTPKWLITTLTGILERAKELPKDLAKYRDMER